MLGECTGLKPSTEASEVPMVPGRTAFVLGRRILEGVSGPSRSENPDTSSDKTCENHVDRKNKVSCTLIISIGLVEPK